MRTKFIALTSLVFLLACGTSNKKEKTDLSSTKTEAASKVIIKASNGQYLSLNPDLLLVANQPDASKAEVFEMPDMGNGKIAFKASNNKFVSADEGINGKLIANRDKAEGWETFEIVKPDQQKVNIKTSKGKFVCADFGIGGNLVGDRNTAGEWETFIIEPKK